VLILEAISWCLKMQRYRQKTIYQGACLLGSKCGKTHLRASVKSKNFPGAMPPDPQKAQEREGRGRKDREEEGRWRGGEDGMGKEGKGKGREGRGEGGKGGEQKKREGEGREMKGTGIGGSMRHGLWGEVLGRGLGLASSGLGLGLDVTGLVNT
jgi:hypothetical protein